jgi:Tfp pilus assembly protein PilE
MDKHHIIQYKASFDEIAHFMLNCYDKNQYFGIVQSLIAELGNSENEGFEIGQSLIAKSSGYQKKEESMKFIKHEVKFNT